MISALTQNGLALGSPKAAGKTTRVTAAWVVAWVAAGVAFRVAFEALGDSMVTRELAGVWVFMGAGLPLLFRSVFLVGVFGCPHSAASLLPNSGRRM